MPCNQPLAGFAFHHSGPMCGLDKGNSSGGKMFESKMNLHFIIVAKYAPLGPVILSPKTPYISYIISRTKDLLGRFIMDYCPYGLLSFWTIVLI